MNLRKITNWLDEELRTAEIVDYAGAINGLQLENNGSVTKVAAAVDATLPVIQKAIDAGADLLLVHHGMFWQGTQPLTGAFYQKIKMAMDANLAIYSSHLPLDVHPQWGNNVALCRALGIHPTETFLPYKGMDVGLVGELNISLKELIARTERAVGGSVHYCQGGYEECRKIGVCTGGAGSEIAAVAAAGVDTFLTGEGPHWSYGLAEELGLNVIYAGHYATETFGVKLLSMELASRFDLQCIFIDHPSGL